MMKVKILTTVVVKDSSGRTDAFWKGSEKELDDNTAKDLIKYGLAELCSEKMDVPDSPVAIAPIMKRAGPALISTE